MREQPDLPPPAPSAAGRRERNKQDKQQRIFDAAEALFSAHGYSAVTTQQIADRADVAIGTVFRYAASKAELLLMVYNARFRSETAHADETLREGATPFEQLAALLTPIVQRGRINRENTLAYEQAMLFGNSHDNYRNEALDLMHQLQQRMAEILAAGWVAQHPHTQAAAVPNAAPAARAIYAALVFESIQAALNSQPVEQQLTGILNQVDVIARGYLHTAPAHNATSAEELTDKSQPTTSKEQRND